MPGVIHEPLSSQLLDQETLAVERVAHRGPRGALGPPTMLLPAGGMMGASWAPSLPEPDNHPEHFSTACNAESSTQPALRTAAALKTSICRPAKQRLGLCQPRSAGPAPVCVWTHFLKCSTFGPSSAC